MRTDLRLATLACAVVDDRDPRPQCMDQHLGVRNRLSMMSHDQQIGGAQPVVRTHQLTFLVPCQVAGMHHSELAERDVAAHRLRVLARSGS